MRVASLGSMTKMLENKKAISNKTLIEIISWIVFFAVLLGLLIYISKKLPG